MIESGRAASGDEACPVCGSPELDFTGVALPYGRISRCDGCGSGILLPRPSRQELAATHARDDYFDHPYFESRRQLTPPLAHRYGMRLRELEARIGPLRGRRILEVGCDTGLFMAYLRDEAGAETIGVDVAHRAVAEACRAGLDVRLGTMEDAAFPAATFDAICAYDLIEHVADPRQFLGEAARILKSGGVIAIETPNFDGLVYRLGRGLAAVPLGLRVTMPGQKRLWPTFHVQYFTGPSLAGLLGASGFDSTEVAGRELSSHELAVGWAVKPIVLGLFALSSLSGANTILNVLAKRV
jgi:2-polyprenyl-3-methyl-5-hydroxy-6-metoxy-1,4-benzoquinol methylase